MKRSNEKDLKIVEHQFASFINQQNSWITDEMYDSFLRVYKENQAEILDQMKDHSDADAFPASAGK